MLKITLDATDEFDAIELEFEHSLVSLSKWEETYSKPFYGKDKQTHEETNDYVRFMLTSEFPEQDFILRLSFENYMAINEYINSNRTATWFREEKTRPGPPQVVTSELIYSWMVGFKIPFIPTETWHLSRLMVLIRACGEAKTPPKKMSPQEHAEHYRSLNEQRRKETGSSG